MCFDCFSDPVENLGTSSVEAANNFFSLVLLRPWGALDRSGLADLAPALAERTRS